MLIPLLATLLRVTSPPTATLSYLVVTLYALGGRVQAIVALLLCWLFNITNHGLGGGPPPGAVVLRYGIYFAAAASVLVHGRNANAPRAGRGIVYGTAALLLTLGAHALVFSQVVDVAVLKTFSFSLVVLTMLAGWCNMDSRDRSLTERMIFGCLGLVALASVPMLLVPAGYMMAGGKLFRGVLVHSQSFGPTMAYLASFLAMQCLVARPLRRWQLVMLGLAFFMVFMSQARIAAVALIGGVLFALLAEVVRSALDRYRLAPRVIVTRLVTAALILVAVLVLFAPILSTAAVEFFQKGEKEISVKDAVYQARGFLVDILINNIGENPLTGIGFGVASLPEERIDVAHDPILGLPIMATIEKGVMPLAVLEELGIPLGVLVLGWLIFLGFRSTRGGIVAVAVYSTVLISNIAESMLFSPGGMGMLAMLLMTWAGTSPKGGAWIRHRSEANPASLPRV